MPAATLRAYDIEETSPDYAVDRYLRLKNFVTRQLDARACQITWLQNPGTSKPNLGKWVAWRETLVPPANAPAANAPAAASRLIGPLEEADVAIAPPEN